MKADEFSKELTRILKKMHGVIGVRYDPMLFEKDDWYHEHEWTVEQEEEFMRWLTYLLKRNKKVRRVITGYNFQVDTETLKRNATLFTSNYGWKTKEDKK